MPVRVEWWDSQIVVDLARRRALTGLRRIGIAMVRDIKVSLSVGGPSHSETAGAPPHVRKGRLRRSIEYKIGGEIESTYVRVGTWTVPYGLMQEKGGTIVPKYAKALAIPIHTDAKRAREQGWGPEFPGFVGKLFMIRRPGKPPLLARRVGGQHARIDIMYVLAASATIPARPYLRPALWRALPMIALMGAGQTARTATATWASPSTVPPSTVLFP